MTETPTTTGDGGEPPARLGLRAKVLLLVAGFVILAEVAIYVPSIANFRDAWLNDRLAAARTAALVFEAAPQDVAPEELRRMILDNVGARTIAMKRLESRRLLAVSDMPPKIDESYDLRDPGALARIAAAFRALFAPPGRVLSVVGNAPMDGEFIEITLDETPLRRAMRAYSVNILLVSLIISGLVASLAMLAIHWMVLRPIRRLTGNLVAFGEAPEDATRIISPSGARDEIGQAEAALGRMQRALARELAQKKHLAALGLAVAKINHDLRNMLASAQLMSDRLAAASDPLAATLAPKLVATLDRAIAFCQATLTYGRAAEPAPDMRRFTLRAVAGEAIEAVEPGAGGRAAFVNSVPEDFALLADRDQILRILLNLLRNAAEALAQAGATRGESARVAVEARREDGRALIEVSDNGPGVPARARERLFEAFHGSTRAGGAGLGLAIAADLARAHGGELTLLADGPGARFRVSLPDRAGPSPALAKNGARP